MSMDQYLFIQIALNAKTSKDTIQIILKDNVKNIYVIQSIIRLVVNYEEYLTHPLSRSERTCEVHSFRCYGRS